MCTEVLLSGPLMIAYSRLAVVHDRVRGFKTPTPERGRMPLIVLTILQVAGVGPRQEGTGNYLTVISQVDRSDPARLR